MASSFSGKAGRNTAVWTAEYAKNAANKMSGQYETGLNNQLGSLGNAREEYSSGLSNQLNQFNQARSEQAGSVNEGANQGLARLGEAANLYRPAYARGEQASGMLSNSLGLNGAEGNQAAVNAFQAGPGYAFQRDQASDLAARKASSLGIAGSGNTLTALATLGSNLANQEYGGWQNRLQGVGQMGMQAAGGIASALSQQAGIDTQRGQNLANIYGQSASNIANAYGQNASNMANTYTNEANIYGQNAQNQAGTTQWEAGQTIPAGQAGMMAGQQAAQNRTNLAMQGVQLGSSLLGSFAGGGGFGGK